MNTRSALALCGLVLLAGGVSAQASGAPLAADVRAGTVKSVLGDVKLQSGTAAPRNAVAGDAVSQVDLIRTGADSGASLVMRDGTAIAVGPSSSLDLKEFKFDATTQDGNLLVSLLRGSLRMVTGAIGKAHPEAVRVETPTAVIGIRGTDFIVETDGKP